MKPESNPQEPVNLPSKHILIVEDDSEWRKILSDVFREEGFKVSATKAAEEALPLLENSQDLPDIALLDIGLPGKMSGHDLLTAIKTAHPRLPAIVMSGQEGSESVIEASRRGAYLYLRKPTDLSLLIGYVNEALNIDPNSGEAYKPSEIIEEIRGSLRLRGPSLRMIGESHAMVRVYMSLGRIKKSDPGNVLILGETGTGKELLANEIHIGSDRSEERFVVVDGPNLVPGLAPSTLFGSEAGAYTSSVKSTPGAFMAADKGTLFLDEIGELDDGMQARLLRVIETGRFTKVGGDPSKPLKVDVRVIAATNRDPQQFLRADLFNRFKWKIKLPPLKDRRDDKNPFFDDIHWLVAHFLNQYDPETKKEVAISDAAVNKLRTYYWPGNVRELRSVLDDSIETAQGLVISPNHIKFESDQEKPKTLKA